VAERGLSALIAALSLGERDALTLPLQDQRPLKLGDCCQHRQRKVVARVAGVAERQAGVNESNAHASAGQLLDGRERLLATSFGRIPVPSNVW
jgi:hypothetical protein